MTKILPFIMLTCITATSFAQMQWELNFDDFEYLNRVIRDTVSNPNCTWQVGRPHKTTFTAPYTAPNAIVTDTLRPIPPNDTSSFYLFHERNNSLKEHIFTLRFWYKMDGDSTDVGIVEISPDSGVTWVNVLIEDTTYDMLWGSPKPTLKGSTNGWQYFYVEMANWASNWGNFPVPMTAEIIFFRFTYISDSSSAPRDGWMIDDFHISDTWIGIDEVQRNNLISIAPVPASTTLTIQRTTPAHKESIQIMNYHGQIVMHHVQATNGDIDVSALPDGIYFLKYTDDRYFAVKKFVVQHE